MSERKVSLFTLPVCSTEFGLQAVYWDGQGVPRAIRFGYYDERRKAVYGRLSFGRVVAMRLRSEICCTAWHIDGCFDQLVEVEGSSWLNEIIEAVPQKLLGQLPQNLRHFMIYLDSAGCFEVISEKYDYTEEVAVEKGE